jgi:hypothetical protein
MPYFCKKPEWEGVQHQKIENAFINNLHPETCNFKHRPKSRKKCKNIGISKGPQLINPPYPQSPLDKLRNPI